MDMKFGINSLVLTLIAALTVTKIMCQLLILLGIQECKTSQM